MEQVQAALLKVEGALRERISDHNTSVTLLSTQLQQALSERDASRQELRGVEESVHTSSSSQQEQLYSQIQVS